MQPATIRAVRLAIDTQSLAPTREELERHFDEKFRGKPDLGWGPKLRLQFGYFTPDDYYETLVGKLVTQNCEWADVGCGRYMFPSNPDLARKLARRARYVFGVDPDDNICDNEFITEGFQGLIEDAPTTRTFDLVTLRMVVEHVAAPAAMVGKLAELTKSGGRVVVYTPNKWSPVSFVTRAVPYRLHHAPKRWLWGTEARDTFPVQFKLNTRKTLRAFFQTAGFAEILFAHLDDCRIFEKVRALKYLELSLQRLTSRLRIRYPENCLLAVYERR